MTTTISRALVGRLVEVLIDGDARRVTKYVSPVLTVKATWQGRRSGQEQTFLVTMGRPNYRERQFIRACQQAGEPFPVRQLQITRVRRPRRRGEP